MCYTGHGVVDVVYPASLETSVEELGLSPTRLVMAVRERHHALLDIRHGTRDCWNALGSNSTQLWLHVVIR